MKELISLQLKNLAKKCPYSLYIVGGRVRDYIAGLKCAKPDTDICAPAPAEDFAERAKASGFIVESVYKNTGTVKLSLNGDDFEFASFRSDVYVRGVHTPVNTFFTDDILLDARRRDFKCNAVYYDIAADKYVDPLGGIKDIERKLVSTVAPAEKVFGEDGLRLMRLARIASQTGFNPTADCINGAKMNARLILDVSVERIYAELNSILHADERYGVLNAQYAGGKMLKEAGVLQYVLPELTEGCGMSQRSDIHKYDVEEHSLRTVMYADKTIRLAALLHDIGKPYCMKNFGNFYNHDAEGARIAQSVCSRLKVPKKLAAETVRLIKLHMYDLRGDARENKIRKLIAANYDIFDKLLLLKQADYSACKDDVSCAPSVVKFASVFEKMRKEGVPLTLKELAVNGRDLLNAGFLPEKVGKTLEKLLSDCVTGQVQNEKLKLCERACKLYKS